MCAILNGVNESKCALRGGEISSSDFFKTQYCGDQSIPTLVSLVSRCVYFMMLCSNETRMEDNKRRKIRALETVC